MTAAAPVDLGLSVGHDPIIGELACVAAHARSLSLISE
jgi:hypothetical protein